MYVPYIQNTMPKHPFKFPRNFINFPQTKDRKKRNENGYNPMFKVAFVLEELTRGMQHAWVAGERLTINESMIQYMGWAVSFVQNMSRNL